MFWHPKKANFRINKRLVIVEETKDSRREEIYSKRVRAGKRTYFFDIKSTRSNDYYLTITESKKRYTDDGHYYEKHKIFLYKEDFNKFVEALNEAVEHVKDELMPDFDFTQFDHSEEDIEAQQNDPPENLAENLEESVDTELKWD